MRTVGVVTVARSDFGLYRPILKKLGSTPGVRTRLIVGGMHLQPRFGNTVREIEAEGFPIHARVRAEAASDRPRDAASAIAQGVDGFSRAYERLRPDLLVALGDRLEMFAAVAAAVPLRLPVAHLHGGESTEGVIDEAFRHAITKMGHLHFPSTAFYARRLVRMGEEPWRVIAAGSPAVDNLRSLTPLKSTEFRRRYGVDLSKPTLLATFHPVTLQPDELERHSRAFLAAIADARMQTVFTAPSADPGGRYLLDQIADHVRHDPTGHLIQHLGGPAYVTAMRHAQAMVGNSSSGIIEAATFRLPVVNVGDRQRGRLRPRNVIDARPTRRAIGAALRRALSLSFRRSLRGLRNSYGDGRASQRIVRRLARVRLDDRLMMKRFHDGGSRTWHG